MSNNKKLKIGDIIYIDILDAENNMLTLLPKNKCLNDKITNITEKYIQTETNLYDVNTNEQILSENDDYASYFKKFYQSEQELFLEREKFKKYKMIYDIIKNETEYASFLKNLPDDILDIIIQTIQQTNNETIEEFFEK